MKEWKKYILIFSIDIILILFWIIFNKPDQSESIVGIFIIPAIFIINIIIALIFFFIDRFKALLFLINSIIAPIIFFLLFMSWYKFEEWDNYRQYYFDKNGVHYELTIYKKVNQYYISEIEPGFSRGLLDNTYKVSKDTTFLENDTVKIFLINDVLFGFPEQNDKIELKNKNGKVQ